MGCGTIDRMNELKCGSPRRLLALVGLTAIALVAAQAARGEAWIRVNQIGYLPDDPKIAVLSSDEPLTGEFQVGEFQADVGADQGAWGPFAHNYRLDFSDVKSAGEYRVTFGEVASPKFDIGADAYANVPGKLLEFMQLQRCGENPLTGKCHQEDGFDTVTGEMVDVTGGWHDAGDRLKHMITTSYCVAALFLAGAEDEARHGAPAHSKDSSQPADDLRADWRRPRSHAAGNVVA